MELGGLQEHDDRHDGEEPDDGRCRVEARPATGIRREPLPHPVDEGRHEQRDGCREQHERGERGHDQPPEAPRLDGRDVGGALDDDVSEEPGQEEPAAGTDRRATAIAPARRRNCSTRALHVNSRRFDMFSRQVSRSRRTGAVEPAGGGHHDRVVEARREPGRLPLRKERHLAEAARLPDRERERAAGASDTRKSGRCVQRRASANATSGPPRNSAFAGFSVSATPADDPREHRLAVREGAKRADGERDRHEHGDGRGKVGLLRQSERLGEELVGTMDTCDRLRTSMKPPISVSLPSCRRKASLP